MRGLGSYQNFGPKAANLTKNQRDEGQREIITFKASFFSSIDFDSGLRALLLPGSYSSFFLFPAFLAGRFACLRCILCRLMLLYRFKPFLFDFEPFRPSVELRDEFPHLHHKRSAGRDFRILWSSVLNAVFVSSCRSDFGEIG